MVASLSDTCLRARTEQHRPVVHDTARFPADKPAQARGQLEQGALIVHPRFVHTLPVAGHQQNSDFRTFADLPSNVLHTLAGLMASACELLRFERVNKACHAASADDAFWKTLVCTKFGWVPAKTPSSWRELYKFQHKLFVHVVLRSRPGDPVGSSMRGILMGMTLHPL